MHHESQIVYWQQLINDKRFGLEDYHDPAKRGSRTEFRRDYDRLVFSSPFRRLQNKTQVFPLPGAIFVHNRLTHSLEVSCVGKSMADSIAAELRQRHAGQPGAEALGDIGDIVSAACLAHDLGNPPFGHSGEKAIATFFSEGAGNVLRDRMEPGQWADLTHFEGNANAFRVLTHQFNGRRPGGFAMTYSMLASVVKYPYEAALATTNKFGFFTTEIADYEKIAAELGIERLGDRADGAHYARHPLVYIVEAADDICYEVMDIEDAHKLRILTTREVTDVLLSYFEPERRDHMLRVMERVDDPNEKVAYMRSCVVGVLVDACARAFVDAEDDILAGRMEGSLLRHVPDRVAEGYRTCSELSYDKIYCAGDVVDIELAGNRIITFLLEKLIHAVLHPDLNYSRLLLAKVPEQYDVAAPTLFGRVQAVLDHISAMTDVYALDLYRRLNGYSLRLES